MQIFGIAKGFHFLAKRDLPELSGMELNYLRAVLLYCQYWEDKLVCRTFGMSRASLYRQVKRFDPPNPSSIKERSRRPRRQPHWPHAPAIVMQGFQKQVSAVAEGQAHLLVTKGGLYDIGSTVGGILSYRKKRGQIMEPRSRVSGRGGY
jgi:hypothetical protein